MKILIQYKYKELIKNIKSILENKQYVLKDMFFEKNWYMFLFINKELIIAKKLMGQNVEIFTFKFLDDFNAIYESSEYKVMKELINKSHMKKYKPTFSIEKTDYLIENMADFLADRAFQTKINGTDSMLIMNEILQDRFAHLYIEPPIQITSYTENDIGLD